MGIRKYVVVPPMTGGLENLKEMASNLWFSWNPDATELFEHLDEQLWEETNRNPQQVLIRLSKGRLEQIREDEGYKAYAARIHRQFRRYIESTRLYDYGLERPVDFTTAYFSLEFGLSECMPIYSGGLGTVAADHLKSAGDLNLPLVGIGIMYCEGYFRQRLKADGWQEEFHPRIDVDTLPIERQLDASGNPLKVSVDLAGGEKLTARILKAQIGRVPLYLLDANILDNPPHLRQITARLYADDRETRICQEILLGIGGCRALAAMGIKPAVYHLNEGHPAFALLERWRSFVEDEGLSLEEAREMVIGQSTITIHGTQRSDSEVFDRWLVEKYFRDFAQRFGLDFETLVRLGRRDPDNTAEPFHMQVMAFRLSSAVNGVSNLHAEVVRKTWREIWPKADLEDVPIGALTNGVHIPSYISRDLAKLYDRYLGHGWSEDPDSEKVWQKAQSIPDIELWRCHERSRSRLVHFARKRLVKQIQDRGGSSREIEQARKVLDPETLTVCFGGPFAPWKRPDLLFREPALLADIVKDPARPVQLIFAGKAQPADYAAKDSIRKIVESIKEEPFRDRVVFLEDYDIGVAGYMVQGADVWLGTTRRPLQACGTLGMKAAANGALNLSVLDGWWNEAYLGDNGWAIGWGEQYENTQDQDHIESRALYNLLQETVKPLFYERAADDLPRDWIRIMKRSIGSICPVFNSHRMISGYVQSVYAPMARNSERLRADGYKILKEATAWKKSISEDWNRISVTNISLPDGDTAKKGEEMQVAVTVAMAGHRPNELRVEVVHGPTDLRDSFKVRHVTRLSPTESDPDASGNVVFVGSMPLTYTGLYAYVVRVTPDHPNLAASHGFDLVIRA